MDPASAGRELTPRTATRSAAPKAPSICFFISSSSAALIAGGSNSWTRPRALCSASRRCPRETLETAGGRHLRHNRRGDLERMRLLFGVYVLDPGTRQLFRGGEPAHLTPKAFELLFQLLTARPRVL